MSSPKFTEKRAGYLAACQSFHKDTEVLMLTTNMIRKDLSSQNTYDAGVALSSLACFLSPDLARDLSGDILSLLSSTRPYIRKKAVLILYKVTTTETQMISWIIDIKKNTTVMELITLYFLNISRFSYDILMHLGLHFHG